MVITGWIRIHQNGPYRLDKNPSKWPSGSNMSKDDYNLAEWLLIRKAQSRNLTSKEMEKWNLFQYNHEAVHLELVEDLSAENFSHIMRTFVARKGHQKLILSDNASQFQLLFKVMDENANFLAKKLIGLTKEALKKAIRRKFLTEREMTTLIVEMEEILNTH
ncbi:Integrase core domain containing protein [Dirofilaria immitis]|nr:Integrase core domain containing protein [Dirofilaria immitis]